LVQKTAIADGGQEIGAQIGHGLKCPFSENYEGAAEPRRGIAWPEPPGNALKAARGKPAKRQGEREQGMARPLCAIGLMSGTSLDGIDAALIETDGVSVSAFGPSLTQAYDPAFRDRLRRALRAEAWTDPLRALEADLTRLHGDAVRDLLKQAGLEANAVDVVGFHGQTINHRPDLGWTWQLGDGPALAAQTDIATVYDLRGADVAAGGQGAPLAPVYHRALARDLGFPLAVLNLGGVANITLLREPDADPIAFDTGPASALLDDWVTRHGAGGCDLDGSISAAGRIDEIALGELLDDPYFARPYPKSLDRQAFDPVPVEALGLEDGAATLAAFTVETVARGLELTGIVPARMIVTGGGRRNPTLMHGLARRCGLPVAPVEDVGWDGDVLEAQAFAFMAVRCLAGLPISFPETTGAPAPMTGGRVAQPSAGPNRPSR
jgi:anhydro-N-acetylmuramic acid kinase